MREFDIFKYFKLIKIIKIKINELLKNNLEILFRKIKTKLYKKTIKYIFV